MKFQRLWLLEGKNALGGCPLQKSWGRPRPGFGFLFAGRRGACGVWRNKTAASDVLNTTTLYRRWPVHRDRPFSIFDVDPVGGTTGTGFLIGNATAPTS
jgi:hypothetical protein